MTGAKEDSAALLNVRPLGIDLDPERRSCSACWSLENRTGERLEIVEAWLPHSGFFCGRETFEPQVDMRAGESAVLCRSVRYAAETGVTVENAFLNLLLKFRNQPWRVLTRMRVARRSWSEATMVVEAITAHRVGFAEAKTEDRA
jgi:hypothetical protein